MTASSQLNDGAEKSVEQRAIVRTHFDRLPGRAVNAHYRQLRGWLLRLKLESCHTVVPNETLLDMRVIRNERTVDLMVPFSKLDNKCAHGENFVIIAIRPHRTKNVGDTQVAVAHRNFS